MKLSVLAGTLALTLSTSAFAVLVPLNSGTGTVVSQINATTPAPPATPLQAVLITPHPAWQPNFADAKWISYAQTGYGGIAVGPNVPGTTSAALNAQPATAVFTHTFTLPGPINTGQLKVWADDTTRVVLDGNVLKLANPVQDSACATPEIGCQPNEESTFLFGSGVGQISLSGGSHTLEFHAYQRGGGPFGLLYRGAISSVPEPGFYGLLGLGLSGLYLTVRRRRSA